MIPFFIFLQFLLLFFMLFHDWIPVKPLNDVATLKKRDGASDMLKNSAINGGTVLIPLILTLIYVRENLTPLPILIILVVFYSIITLGTILSWWIPYLFGSSKKHKERFSKFKKTHHFLPARGNNVIPNTLHVILHLQVWACLGISLYLLSTHK